MPNERPRTEHDKVLVAVRVRPLSDVEASLGDAWRVAPQHATIAAKVRTTMRTRERSAREMRTEIH